ncbi:hypothetical protein M5T12_10510 [Enterobacter asburiae]|uniref:hypothetical protein n=1 Tax=Enterobacter asburiae TaxID=61645 RepID=UPI00217630AC|nr:hypothetical protein [Enterobacter asburiae]UWA77093.1 hypothetical protein M5T12_10510 [Enterobacter asburiae]
MSTITRELAKLFRKITNSEIDAEGNAHVVLSPADSLLINNARIALASLEAEPVAWAHRLINKRNGVVHPWVYGSAEACPSEGDIFNIEVMPLYTAPPAPVSVPDEATPDNIDILASTYAPRGVTFQWDRDECNAAADSWNACRDAMLQGAEPVTTAYKLRDAVEIIRNSGIEIDSGKIQAERDSHNSPVIPDCSCRTCRPVTFSDSRFVVCPECGNKRCPHANDHRNACSGSNEPGQEGSAYPAAPQQEVK